MDPNDISQQKTRNFPACVSEIAFATEAEMQAFLIGLGYAADIDVHHGEPFTRGGKYVVRVRVGEWDDDE